MSHSTAVLSTVAEFPKGSFLENLAVRRDGSILTTELNSRQLWYVPCPPGEGAVEPLLVHTFDELVLCPVETDDDVFYVATSNVYTDHSSHLWRLDLCGWAPGEPVAPQLAVTFDDRVQGLNGACLVAPGVILLADCFAGLIWRVDLDPATGHGTAGVWLKHPSMDDDPTSTMTPRQPGVNGIQYAARRRYLYYTSTAQKLFMRVKVDPGTHQPAGEPERVGGGTMADDFCLDEDSGVAYLTTHRENTIDRVPLTPQPDASRNTVAGHPLDTRLLGPSSMAWGREPGDHGRTAYVTSDGGTTAPLPDGTTRTAKVLRMRLVPPAEGGSVSAAANQGS